MKRRQRRCGKGNKKEEDVMWSILVGIWLLVISILDIRFRRVPMWLLALGGGLAAAMLLWGGRGDNLSGCYDVVKGLAPGVLLLAVAFSTRRAGCGDGIALMILGLISEGGILLVFGLSLFLAALFSILLLVLRKAGCHTRIPYLPFLAAAWLFVSV